MLGRVCGKRGNWIFWGGLDVEYGDGIEEMENRIVYRCDYHVGRAGGQVLLMMV